MKKKDEEEKKIAKEEVEEEEKENDEGEGDEEIDEENDEVNNEENDEEKDEEKSKQEQKEEIKEEVKEAIEKATKKQGKFLKEFREFALKGNAFDLAVGVLIGGAFQNIVTSLTNNIISPILGLFGGINFSDHVLKIGKLTLTYGAFITDVINFIIMALVIFLMMKFMNKLSNLGHKKDEVVEATTKICPHCYSEINIKADRCPYCTSEIEINKEEK